MHTTKEKKELTIDVSFETRQQAADAKNAVAYAFLFGLATQSEQVRAYQSPELEHHAVSLLKVYQLLDSIEAELPSG